MSLRQLSLGKTTDFLMETSRVNGNVGLLCCKDLSRQSERILCMLYRWDFGDGSGKVIQSKDAPCQIMGQPIEKEKKQMYVQDSVSFTYLIPGNQMYTHTHTYLYTDVKKK